jgi:hypothetical protein
MAPEIDGKVYVTEFVGVNDAAELPSPGTMATIEITETQDYDLVAKVIEMEKFAPAKMAATETVATVSTPRSGLVSISMGAR